ncbi:MAG: DNA polymerase III subunit gamma/tau, partial [Candidatus Lightella neohaematopini]|nr:DNA polymerase III subunit gamma/tau [Candidatus Lightella neohaematopini]
LKWRPKCFNDLVGQDHIVSAFTNAFNLNRIHHAYIFSGSYGIGKTTIARLLAKSLNCINNSINVCNTCDACLEIQNNCFVDLIEFDAASSSGIDNIKELIENAQYFPVKGKFKIYLIDEVHMLSRSSFNALLKIIEEPPLHIKFLLATTEYNKIPKVITSRCLHFNLVKIDIDKIILYLKSILAKEQIFFDEQAIIYIANTANGSLRDALNLTDQAIIFGKGKIVLNVVVTMLGIIDNNQLILIIELIISNNVNQLIDVIDSISKNNINWEQFLIDILLLLHNILLIKIIPNYNFNYNKNILFRLSNISKSLSTSIIKDYINLILNGYKELLIVNNKKLVVEIILLKLINY